MTESNIVNNSENIIEEPIILKRGRGRPKKEIVEPKVKKPKGRPKGVLKENAVSRQPEYYNDYYKAHYSHQVICPDCYNPKVLRTNMLRHMRTNKCFFDRINGIYCEEIKASDVKTDD